MAENIIKKHGVTNPIGTLHFLGIPLQLLSIIQSTVSTLQAREIKDKKNFEKTAEFYNHLANVFQLQYGKILLSTAPKEQIQSILDNGQPFFSDLTQEVELCLNGTSCDAVQKAMQSLGDTFTFIFYCQPKKFHIFDISLEI